MAVKPSKVLTISLRDYCESREKEIGDYAVEGVHSFGIIGKIQQLLIL